jgi:hypothetical protein
VSREPAPARGLDRWSALAVAGSLAILVVARFRAITDPAILGYDESLFLVQGMAWAKGLVPGLATWVNKPPLFEVPFAASYAIFGATPIPLRIAQLVALLACSFICGRAVRAGSGPLGEVVAAWATALASSTGLPPGEVLPCFSEAFFVLPLVLAPYLALARARPDGRPPWVSMLLSGAALGVAIQIRQNALLLVPIVGAAVFFHPAFAGIRRRVAASALFALGLIGSFAPIVLYLAAKGALAGAVYWCWTYPRIVQTFAPGELLGPGIIYLVQAASGNVAIVALLVLGVIALARDLLTKGDARRRAALWLAFLGAGGAMCMLGGRFYGHYYVMLAPALGIVAGVGAAMAVRRIEPLSPGLRRIALSIAGLLLAATSALSIARAAMSAAYADWSMENRAAASRGPLLAWIREQTAPGDRIFILGTCPGLYYRAERVPAAPDLSGELVFGSSSKGHVLNAPASGGRVLPLDTILAEGVGKATLVLDLTSVPEPRRDQLSGQRVRWDHVGAGGLERVPLVVRELERSFAREAVSVEGVVIYRKKAAAP